jgi:hypothetical protein
VNCASVGVVRVPRIYNVLIRSDGALAPSEAVSADSPHDQPSQDKSRAPNDDSEDDYGEETRDEEEGEEEKEEEKVEKEDPLPVLDPKNGAIQDNVNYTAVPLSRAYPLTRYTAPIIAAHYPISYLSPLHGGLILGPVPRLPTPLQHHQQQQQQQYQEQAPREERTELGVPSLQSMYQAQQQQQQQRQESRSVSSLFPNGAFEDYDRDSVAVEAGEEQN